MIGLTKSLAEKKKERKKKKTVSRSCVNKGKEVKYGSATKR